MYALDWLNKRGRILHGAVQPIECFLFATLLLSISLSLQCDQAFTVFARSPTISIYVEHAHVCSNWVSHSSMYSQSSFDHDDRAHISFKFFNVT